jgi:hypothetical protein
MARKPTDIVQYKLRIRENLRRRIEHAATKNGVSANQEMANRLQRSFEVETVRKLEALVEYLANLTECLMSLDERGIFGRAIERRTGSSQGVWVPENLPAVSVPYDPEVESALSSASESKTSLTGAPAKRHPSRHGGIPAAYPVFWDEPPRRCDLSQGGEPAKTTSPSDQREGTKKSGR